jgi:hypothetical protein
MVPFLQILIPVVASAIAVFIASSISHMVLPHHRNDFTKIPSEDEVMDAMRKFSPPHGDYIIPCPTGPNAMKDPAYLAKVEKGPIMVMTVMPNRFGEMGKLLGIWFFYLLVVMALAGHATSRVVGIGAPNRDVFHTIFLFVFAAMGLALMQNSIWYARKWSTTFKSLIDSAVYAAIAGGIFLWLWP